jgi:hypothetical protein
MDNESNVSESNSSFIFSHTPVSASEPIPGKINPDENPIGKQYGWNVCQQWIFVYRK